MDVDVHGIVDLDLIATDGGDHVHGAVAVNVRTSVRDGGSDPIIGYEEMGSDPFVRPATGHRHVSSKVDVDVEGIVDLDLVATDGGDHVHGAVAVAVNVHVYVQLHVDAA